MFRAFDKKTGRIVWEMELPGGTSGAPMTYMVNGKQYIVVAIVWRDMPGELIALALPCDRLVATSYRLLARTHGITGTAAFHRLGT